MHARILFKVDIQPSKRLLWLIIFLHVVTLLAILLYSRGGAGVLWVLCWLGSVGWALHGYSHLKINTIIIDAQGQAWLELPERHSLIKAQLHPHSLARASLLSLHWCTEYGSIHQLLLFDMTEGQSWRRLQVWVRWCQPTRQRIAELIDKLRTFKTNRT